MATKFLLETLRQADGGRVECVVETDLGSIRGVIEPSFFEEFTGGIPATQPLSAARKQRILADNEEWLESEAKRQLNFGTQTIVIR